MTEEQDTKTTVDPIEQAREEGYRKGLYQGRREAEKALFTEFYSLVAKLDPHFEGLVIVRALIMSHPYYGMDIPEGMTSIDVLSLGGRTSNLMKREGVKSVELLLTMNEADLLDLRQFGEKSLKEVKEALAVRGLELKPL